MKIAISAKGKSLESEIDMRFGRCQYFIFVNIKDGRLISHKIIDNDGSRQSGGAGISAAETVAKNDVNAIIKNRCSELTHCLKARVYPSLTHSDFLNIEFRTKVRSIKPSENFQSEILNKIREYPLLRDRISYIN